MRNLIQSTMLAFILSTATAGMAMAAIGDPCTIATDCADGERCSGIDPATGISENGSCEAPEMPALLVPAFLLAGAGYIRHKRRKAAALTAANPQEAQA